MVTSQMQSIMRAQFSDFGSMNGISAHPFSQNLKNAPGAYNYSRYSTVCV